MAGSSPWFKLCREWGLNVREFRYHKIFKKNPDIVAEVLESALVKPVLPVTQIIL